VNSTELLETLRPLLSGVPPEPGASTDQTTIGVPADSIVEVCRVLREHPSLGFVFLADITAVDWWPREPRFEVVYHLASATDRLRLKVQVPGTHLPTVQSVWAGANSGSAGTPFPHRGLSCNLSSGIVAFDIVETIPDVG